MQTSMTQLNSPSRYYDKHKITQDEIQVLLDPAVLKCIPDHVSYNIESFFFSIFLRYGNYCQY